MQTLEEFAMFVRIPVTKVYQIDIDNGGTSTVRTVSQAEQLARSMTIDQIEQTGTLVLSEAGRVHVVRPIDSDEPPSYTD